MNVPRTVLLALLATGAACGTWRVTGNAPIEERSATGTLHGVSADESRHAPPRFDPGQEASIEFSTYPAHSLPGNVPPTPAVRSKEALYYSDMGPDTIDVSAYPSQQRFNYEIFAQTCSRCHTLARPINAPLVSRGWWEFYLLSMRMRSRRAGRPLTKDETGAILDFLEFDSRVRKVEHSRTFDASTEELKRRFDEEISMRLHKLQRTAPRLLPSTER